MGSNERIDTRFAYNFAIASNYNRFPRPAVLLVNAGAAGVNVRRETYEEIAARDEVPARLRRVR